MRFAAGMSPVMAQSVILARLVLRRCWALSGHDEFRCRPISVVLHHGIVTLFVAYIRQNSSDQNCREQQCLVLDTELASKMA
jgi:hypothetical protein